MAAGDIALKLLISASDLASAVIVDMAATYSDSILAMMNSTVALSDALTVLGEQATATSLEFDTIATSADAADISFANFDLSISELDASLTSIDATTASADASIASLDASLASIDASAIGTSTSLDTVAASETAAGDAAELSQSKMMGMGMVAAGIVVAVAAIGVASLKAAGDWESSTNTLVTGAGEQASNLDMVRQGMLKLSVDTGTTSKSLVAGMFMIESAGFHGADGLNVLKAAAMGAKVGNADLGTVSDATTTIMTDFGLKSGQASIAVNTLIATVANGKTTMNALSGALSQVLPTASSAKIGLNDTMAAMATMTGEGVPAANAATYLRQTIMALVAPSKQTVTALQGVGLSSSAVATEMQKSLPGALAMITDAVGKKFPEGSTEYVAALKNIAGGSKQMQGILDLTGTHMATFTGNVHNIGAAVQQGGNSITGWSVVQGSFNQKMAQGGAALEAAAISIGTKLLPAVSQILGAITPLISRFAAWVGQGDNLKNMLPLIGGALAGFAVIILALVIPAIISMGASLLAMEVMGAPIILIVLAVIAVVALIILAIQHWGQIVAWLSGVWSAFASWFGGVMSAIGTVFHTIWTGIQNFFVAVWNFIVNAAKIAAMVLLAVIIGPLGLLVIFIVQHWGQIVNVIQNAIKTVVGWFVWLFNHNYYFHDLVVGIMVVFTAVKNFLINLWTTVTAWLASAWNTIKLGAIVAWTAITSSIHSALTTAWNWIVSVWTMAVGFLLGIWNRITGQVGSAWSRISSIFGSAWSTYIAGPLGGLWNSFTGWFNNLISQVGQWGANLMQGFINGIMGMLGNLKGALGSVMSTVAGWLGFHSPTKEGEGRYIVEWGAGMVKGFVAGMQQAQPLLNAQVNHMISAPNTIGYAGGGGNAGAGNAFALSSGGNTHTIIVQMHPSDVYLDNKKVGESVMKYANSQVHVQGAYRNG